MSQDTSVLVLGAGPAGLTAAIALARQRSKCIVFDSGNYRNDAVDYMHLIPGLDHVAPAEFRTKATSHMTSYYSEYISIISNVNITQARQSAGVFEVVDDSGRSWKGNKLILAHGVQDCFPDIKGYADCWGQSIFHCLFCKGFEQSSAGSAGVLAGPMVPHVLHTARQAAALTSGTVTIYTNGNESLTADVAASIGSTSRMKIDSRQIQQVANDGDVGITIEFADGSPSVTEGFLSHTPPTKPRGPFISQLGLETSPNGDLKVTPPFNQTSLRGVFAAGDICSMLKTVPNAIWTGNLAAQGVLSQLQAEAHGQKPLFG